MKKANAMKHAGIIVALTVLLLSGCATKVQTLTYDKPIPENQSATLIIPGPYTVTSFDGEAVKWTTAPDGFSLSGSAAAIRLPSGKHNISYSFYQHIPGQTTYEHYGSGAMVQRRTASRTTSFDGNITIHMDAGKRYIFKGRGIVIDTDDQYDKLP